MSKATSTSPGSYPKSIFLIMATEFCERFSFCGLRTILSLYLRNILLFGENTATIIYHVFIMLCYFIPILGASLADSFLGRFRTIFYFGVVFTVGTMFLCVSAIPPFINQAIVVSMSGLILIAMGTGGIKPCVAAFGGDQFRLPQQQQLLDQFFSIYYFTINFGGLMGMIITPVLRTAIHCFGYDSCYSIGFGFPAILMVVALVVFVCGKPFYKIKSPKENVIMSFVNCVMYALVQKCKSTDEKPKSHWLDYAHDRYDPKLITEMKTVFAIFFLYIPLPLFWSLGDQQGSRWTFQASRTNGKIFGVSILPDQVQVINPAIVLLLIPFLEKTVYPFLDREQMLTSPLQRMVTGGFISALAFMCSGILEVNLEKTYPILPGPSEAHINFINLLPCQIQLVNPFNSIQILKSGSNYLFKNIKADDFTEYSVDILAPYDCGKLYIASPWKKLRLKATEFQVDTVFIFEYDSKIEIVKSNNENLEKTVTGKPKLRIIFVSDKKSTIKSINVRLKNYQNIVENDLVTEGQISTSDYKEYESGIYQFSIFYPGRKSVINNGTLQLDTGGVYSLVIQQRQERIIFVKVFMMTSPNTIHMLWLLPQYLLISVGEAIFAIAGLQFTFTQAPKSMKTVTLAAWYLSIALGNLLVIIVTQLHLFKSQSSEFFFYALLVFMDMIVFHVMTSNYQFVTVDADDSTTTTSIRGLEGPLAVHNLSSISHESFVASTVPSNAGSYK